MDITVEADNFEESKWAVDDQIEMNARESLPPAYRIPIRSKEEALGFHMGFREGLKYAILFLGTVDDIEDAIWDAYKNYTKQGMDEAN